MVESGFPSDQEAFDEVKTAVFVGAHPDDIEGCAGGTIRKLVLKGIKVFAVNCTLGDIGSKDMQISRTHLAKTRLSEAEKAAKILGIHHTFNLGYPDGELEPSLQLRSQLAEIYRITQADALFTFDPFWPEELHGDHRICGQVALDAVIPSKTSLYRNEQLGDGISIGKVERIFLFYPERNQNVDVVVDISKVFSTKVDALLCHESQFSDRQVTHSWLAEWNRKTGTLISVDYAEGFRQFRPIRR